MAEALLQQQIDSLKKHRGDTVPVDELGDILDGLIGGARGDLHVDSVNVGQELRQMLQEIGAVKGEVVGIKPRTMATRNLPGAQDELDSIVRSTEGAAEKIMDAADRLSQLSDDIEGEAGEKVMALTTEIFEASSFQDLTGQRVTKVYETLRLLEERLTALAEAIGDDHIEEDDESVFDAQGNVVNEDNLTHGPQLEGEAATQADIDALFDSL